MGYLRSSYSISIPVVMPVEKGTWNLQPGSQKTRGDKVQVWSLSTLSSLIKWEQYSYSVYYRMVRCEGRA